MAQWHTAEATRTGLNVVVHFLVPAGNNAVGVTWKAAALKAGISGGEASPWADAGEAAGIADGSVVELRMEVSLDRTQELNAQRVAIQAAVTAAIAQKKSEWAEVLKQAGYSEGTVV